jgi:hypothetical protein
VVAATALAGTTRTGSAMGAMLKAAERLRRLHVEEQAAFAEYAAAREACAGERVVVDVEMPPGQAASYAEWKRQNEGAT